MATKPVEVPGGPVKLWKGEADRAFRLQRPCSCGCDQRDGYQGVGYLSGSDSKGNGFTMWIQSEKVYQIMAKSMKNCVSKA